MATYTNLRFYAVDPDTIFSTTVGNFSTYSGPADATGMVTIVDNESGGTTTLDDDNNGSETATGNVFVNGNSSSNTTLDAEAVWTVRDTLTGQTFEIVQLDVENGGAAGNYMLSEQPLESGRSYEIIDYNSNPDAESGTAAFTYGDYRENNFDGLVEGTAGDDTIDSSYSGDVDGDRIDAGDATTATTTGLDFNWSAAGADNANVAGGITQDTGGIQVDVSFVTSATTTEVSIDSSTAQYVATGEDFNGTSSLYLNGTHVGTDTTTTIIEFSSVSGSGFDDEVQNVTFRVNDVDEGGWTDELEIRAYDADGNLVSAQFNLQGNDSDASNGSTLTGGSNQNDNADQADGSALVTIPGPVARIELEYGNGQTAGQVLYVTDVHFDATTSADQDLVYAGDGNDVVSTGLDNDTVYAGTGNDSVSGGVGDDELYGEDGDDTLEGGAGADTLIAGIGMDYADYSASGAGVNVNLNDNTATGGDAQGDWFNGIDGFYGSDYADSMTGTDAQDLTPGPTFFTNIFYGGAGNDSLYGLGGNDSLYGEDDNDLVDGGTGDDLVDGGAGNDTLLGGDGTDTVVGGAGADNLQGGAGDDILQGDAGNDTLEGGSGADTIEGGDGDDLIRVLDGFGADEVLGGEGAETGGLTGGDVLDGTALTGDAVVDFTAINAADPESGTLSMGGETLQFEQIEIVRTGAGNDSIIGGDGDERIATGAGQDTVNTGAGDDTIALNTGQSGGDGVADTVILADGSGNDTIVEFDGPIDNGDGTYSGIDQLEVSGMTTGTRPVNTHDVTVSDVGGSALLTFPNGETVLLSGITPAQLATPQALAAIGIPLPDGIVRGTAAGDLIDGSYAGDNDGDMVDAGDAVPVGAGADQDTILAGAGDDTVFAGAGNDNVAGEAGDDSLEGGAGDDVILGGDGADTLIGGSGSDTLSGGADADVFDQATALTSETFIGGEGTTTGVDFDTIDFSGMSGPVTVIYDGDESGTITDGGVGSPTSDFSEIEAFVLTDYDDSVSSGGDTLGHAIAAGAGDDTIWAGLGNDTLSGGSGADEIFGDAGDDAITGGLGNDDLGGDAGNDTVSGDAGDDFIQGGAGNDSLSGGDDNDTLLGGSGADTMSGDAGDDRMVGGTGSDSLSGGSGSDTMLGGDDNDILDGGDGADDLSGDAGSDTLSGGAGADTLAGGSGNDSLSGGDDSDTLTGGAGNDTMDGGAGDDIFVLEEGFGTDSVTGGETGETNGDVLDASLMTSGVTVDLSAVDPADGESGTLSDGTNTATFSEIEMVLTGSGGDSVTGSDGADMVATGYGADTVDGGAGDDTFDLGNDGLGGGDGAADTVVFGDGDGADTVFAFEAPTDNGDGTYTGADQLDLSGLTDAQGHPVHVSDVVVSDDGSGNALLSFPNGESLTLMGVAPAAVSDPAALQAMGVPGPDYVVTGTAGDDLIDASYVGDVEGDMVDAADAADGSDDDVINAGDGNDTVLAGAGNDSVTAGSGHDRVEGGIGDDTVSAGAGDDTVLGGAGNDSILGYEGSDSVDGGDGDDYINTRTSTGTGLPDTGYPGSFTGDGDDANDRDTVQGGTGNDTILTGDDDDIVDGGDGADSIDAGFDDDTVTGGAGADTITGGEGNDSIEGGADNDLIYGDDVSGLTAGLNIPDDTDLVTDNGLDTLRGGDGDDTIYGMDDNDLITGDAGNDLLDGGYDDDTVHGGDGDDTILLNDQFGSDLIIGGEGGETAGDTLDMSGLTTGVTVNLTGNDPEAGSVSDGSDTSSFSEIENIILGGGADTVVLADGSGADVVQGFSAPTDNFDGTYSGVDQLDVSGMTDAGGDPVNVHDVVVGDDGSGNAILTFPNGENITLLGVSPADVTSPQQLIALGIPASDGIVSGTAGNDTIDGVYSGDPDGDMVDGDDAILPGHTGDDDSILAGAGDDLVLAGRGNDTVHGGSGADTLAGGLGDDSLLGGDDADAFVLTNGGADTVVGGEGGTDADTLNLSGAGSGADILFSGDEAGQSVIGTDTVDFSEIEQIIATSGDDTVNMAADTGGMILDLGDGNDSATGGSGADQINAGAGDDTVAGGDGDDTINAGAGADDIAGGAGNDEITLGSGDIAWGEDGDDTFIVDSALLNGGAITIDGGEAGETAGDTLNVFGPANIIYDGGNPENGTVTYLDGSVVNFSNIENVTHVPCFTEHSMITTRRGLVPAGQLRIGDMVQTRDEGMQPIRWVGRREMTGAQLAQNPKLNPVLIRAGALGHGLPERDLLVSPQHRMLVGSAKVQLWFAEDEVLVAARHLTCLDGVEQIAPDSVTYVHFMFDSHQVVMGEGTWSESFQPGDHVLRGMDDAQRNELAEIFPELRCNGGTEPYPAVRLTLKRHEVPLLFMQT